MQSIRLLSDGMESLNRRCVQGVEPNLSRMDELMKVSLMLAIALMPHIEYERSADIAKETHQKI